MPGSVIETYAEDVLKDNLKSFDMGLVLGIEYQFNNRIFVEARYTTSFFNQLTSKLDISSVEAESTKMDWKDELGIRPSVRYSSLQIGIGYRF